MGAPPIFISIYRNGIFVKFGRPEWISNASWANSLKVFASTEPTIKDKNRKVCSSLVNHMMKKLNTGNQDVDEAIGGVTKSIYSFDSVDVSLDKVDEDYYCDPSGPKR